MGAVDPDDALVRELIIAVFRLNGRIIETSNQLVADLGLTSALWQVLGALSGSPVPLPVAHIARNMGLSRQGVQRITDLLVDKGMAGYEANPHHQRAKLVMLTTAGRAAEAATRERERPLARALAASAGRDRLAAALAVLGEFETMLGEYSSGLNSNEKDVA